MGHLTDTDSVWATFYDDCFEVKEACHLRAPDSASVDIENRMTDVLENSKQRLVYTVSNGNARLITYRDMKLAIYWTAMAPGFATTFRAAVLDSLTGGHTNAMLDFPFENILTAKNSLHEETQDGRANSNADVGTAVNCGNAEDITNRSVADFKNAFQHSRASLLLRHSSKSRGKYGVWADQYDLHRDSQVPPHRNETIETQAVNSDTIHGQ